MFSISWEQKHVLGFFISWGRGRSLGDGVVVISLYTQKFECNLKTSFLRQCTVILIKDR